jgi:hypothetical protein
VQIINPSNFYQTVMENFQKHILQMAQNGVNKDLIH